MTVNELESGVARDRHFLSRKRDGASQEEMVCYIRGWNIQLLAQRHPILERVLAARSLHPPRDSITCGTKDTPTAWQEVACAAIFFSSLTASA